MITKVTLFHKSCTFRKILSNLIWQIYKITNTFILKGEALSQKLCVPGLYKKYNNKKTKCAKFLMLVQLKVWYAMMYTSMIKFAFERLRLMQSDTEIQITHLIWSYKFTKTCFQQQNNLTCSIWKLWKILDYNLFKHHFFHISIQIKSIAYIPCHLKGSLHNHAPLAYKRVHSLAAEFNSSLQQNIRTKPTHLLALFIIKLEESKFQGNWYELNNWKYQHYLSQQLLPRSFSNALQCSQKVDHRGLGR